jgi:hypothetical protein
MEITKEEIEKILGYEIVNYKITKKAFRGRKVSKITLAVQPKKDPESITVTIKPTK